MLNTTRSTGAGIYTARVAVDEEADYWSADTAIMRVGIDGTDVETLAARNQTLAALALGPTDVFWGSAQQIPIQGGAEETRGIRRIAK